MDPLGLDALRHPQEEGLSLDELSQAFAQMLQTGDDPYTDVAEPDDAAETEALAAEVGLISPAGKETTADDACPISPRSILEAMLFVGRPDNQPLSREEVAALMRGVAVDEIDELVAELNDQYATSGCPYQIIGEGAGYRLVLHEEYEDLREKFTGKLREARLSQAAIDVLSLVAYNQPVSADDVAKLRGKPSGSLLSQLVRRQLIRIERPDEKPRKLLYFTTERFLELFGLSSLEDLPRQEDIENRL